MQKGQRTAVASYSFGRLLRQTENIVAHCAPKPQGVIVFININVFRFVANGELPLAEGRERNK